MVDPCMVSSICNCLYIRSSMPMTPHLAQMCCDLVLVPRSELDRLLKQQVLLITKDFVAMSMLHDDHWCHVQILFEAV